MLSHALKDCKPIGVHTYRGERTSKFYWAVSYSSGQNLPEKGRLRAVCQMGMFGELEGTILEDLGRLFLAYQPRQFDGLSFFSGFGLELSG